MFIDLFAAKKLISRFKLNMYMLVIKSPAFYPAFQLCQDMTSLVLILYSFLQLNSG